MSAEREELVADLTERLRGPITNILRRELVAGMTIGQVAQAAADIMIPIVAEDVITHLDQLAADTGAHREPEAPGFFETDEPVNQVIGAFDRGEKGVTSHQLTREVDRLRSALLGIKRDVTAMDGATPSEITGHDVAATIERILTGPSRAPRM